MRIEIAEQGRMIQTGSSLIKLIQNNTMPILDLLVRESLQNSLDARKKNAKYVDVEYLTGVFNSKGLNEELEGITDALNERYTDEQYEYIAVCDSNTVGLTGETDPKKVKNNDYGNLLKLVYEVCRPQEAEGAGGSWGLGKTIYFRIGIGLVIYYSRILREDGEYESRLAATLVENETSPDSMIPVYESQAKRGIAWWGSLIDKNLTEPEKDTQYIEKFLGLFGIKPYENEKTGTVIIIPYINRNSLLSNNQVEYLDFSDNRVIPFWCHSIEDYLSIASQRWYAPRLGNVHYTHEAFLRLKINGKGIGPDVMEPVFKVVQALYNRANHINEDDILSENSDDTKVEPIKVTKYLNDSTIGVVAYTKIPRELLGMNAPRNKPEPYVYFNCEIRDSNLNLPTICFTRKPAMIVAYENMGPWTGSIHPSPKNEYIIGIFVLNTGVQLKNCPLEISLEEYARKSEMADHTSWNDWSEGNYNPRLITKIQNNVTRIIAKDFSADEESVQPKVQSGLGRLMGDILLPPEGFGKNAGNASKGPTKGPGQSGGPSGDTGSGGKGYIFKIDYSRIKYLPGRMILPFVLRTTSKKIDKVAVELCVDSEAKKIDFDEWETQLGLDAPFAITSLRISTEYIDDRKISSEIEMSENENSIDIEGITISRKLSTKGTCSGYKIVSESAHSIKMHISATVKINRTDVKPVILFEKEA